MKKKFIEDAFLISFPKAGRTWIRVLLAKLLQNGGGNPRMLELIRYRHDGAGDLIFHPHKDEWKDKRIILMVRNPKDIIISWYFQATLSDRKREIWDFKGDLSDFIRDEEFGIRTIVNFYNCWGQNLDVPKSLMLLRYEDLKENTLRELKRVCDFLGIDDIGDFDLQEVIKYAHFDNMKEMDLGIQKNILSNRGGFMNPGTDPERLKVRRGKVDGYKDYLNEEDIAYVEDNVKLLNSYYGYG
jgi:hypothetical protein